MTMNSGEIPQRPVTAVVVVGSVVVVAAVAVATVVAAVAVVRLAEAGAEAG